MKLIYPALFHKEEGTYWAEFPDLPGCQTFGDTAEETLTAAQEALEGFCMAMLEDKQSLPKASSIEAMEVPAGCFTSLVETDISHYLNRERAIKKTLTIPAWINDLAMERNIKFSEVLQDALLVKLGLWPQ